MISKYQLRVDGEVLADLIHAEYAYQDAKLKNGVNIAGTLLFKLMPNNPIVDSLNLLKSTITVLRDGQIEWIGRPIKNKKTALNMAEISCEGALAWLNDIHIQPLASYTETTAAAIISDALSKYNSKCSANRAIQVGSLDATYSVTLENKTKMVTAFDLISEIIDTVGGFVKMDFSSGVPILNYHADALASGIEVRFGDNLIDINTVIDVSKVITAVYATDSETTTPTLYQNADAVNAYGLITDVKDFGDSSTSQTLEEKAQAFLRENVLGNNTINVKAFLFNEKADIGTKARVVSKPHGIDTELLISQVNLNLNDSAKDEIVLGNQQQNFTRQIAKKEKKTRWRQN